MQLSKQELRQAWVQDKRKGRRKLLLAAALTLAVFLFCLSFRYNACYFEDKFLPGVYFRELFLAARLGIAHLLSSMNSYQIGQAILDAGETDFWGALAQLKLTFQSFVAGGGLALAGAIFQTVYKNPLASPNMLGATAGVKLGNIFMVTVYSAAAVQLVALRYRYCYLFTAICVACVLALGKAAGHKTRNTSVMEMVMAGSVMSQGLNVFSQYYMYRLEDEDLLLYQELTLGTYQQLDAMSMVAFTAAMAVSILPVVLLRFRFNAVAMDGDEAAALGLHPAPLRIVGQICGVLMVTAAMIHVGDVGMVALVVPYTVRLAVGANFKYVCVYSILVGGSLLMLCRLAASFILVADAPLPVSFLLDMVLSLVFFVILVRQGQVRN